MKQTTTELLIEVEETIYVIHKGSQPVRNREADINATSEVIEICPHCHRAIFAAGLNEVGIDIERDRETAEIADK